MRGISSESGRLRMFISVNIIKQAHTNIALIAIRNEYIWTIYIFILYSSIAIVNHQWPLLLTWFNFNPSMDK